MFHSESLSKPLIRTNVYLSEDHREAIFALAKAQDISGAELIRRVLDKYLQSASAR
jgi:hypothetical protein